MVSAEKLRKLISDWLKIKCHYFRLYLTNLVWKIIKKMIKSLISVLFILSTVHLYAQPELKIKPGKIEFEDVFHRLEKVYFINEGNSLLFIDSITYLQNRYFLRWDSYSAYPIILTPGDTISMDCILSEYYNVSPQDTVDTMFVYANYTPEPLQVKMKINFYEENYAGGIIRGTVLTNGNPAPETPVYLLKDGAHVFRSVTTDPYGEYEFDVPPGVYLVAAAYNSNNLYFAGNTPNIFAAEKYKVMRDSVYTADIEIVNTLPLGFTVEGVVLDSVSGYPVDKGVVVIRKGKHNPNKPVFADSSDEIYTAISGNRGVYKISGIAVPGYYFAQAFSNYFTPSYFRNDSNSAVFWQNADSILINSNKFEINFTLLRDSSYGDGSISGSIQGGGIENIYNPLLFYARTVSNNIIYSSGISFADNTFTLPKLPYGTYILQAQSIYQPDLGIGVLEISPQNTTISNVTIYLTDADDDQEQPEEYILLHNFPNPFNSGTKILVEIRNPADGEITLYSSAGEELETVYSGRFSSGQTEYKLDMSGYASGIYFLRFSTSKIHRTIKLMLLK